MKKNKILKFVTALTLFLCVFALYGCGKSDNANRDNQESTAKGAKYTIVCTTFPQYDWVRNIIGENSDRFDLKMLINSGVDLHSFKPSAEDIVTIAGADMFVYVGGESDGWVDGALKESTNPDMKVVNMLEALGDSVKEEEVVEGMQAEEEENEEAATDGESDKEEEEPEYDEHVWLSLQNAEVLTRALSEKIIEIDSDSKDIYKANADKYIGELTELDKQYEEVADASAKKTILFGDRFPFRYLADDYDLTYYAAFVGCSAESEASFETITFLAGKMDELGLSDILVIEGSDEKIAKSIISNTKGKNQSILVMNSLQSVTSKDVDSGVNYVDVMKANLETLKQAID